MARSVRDAAAAFDVLCGHDPRDPWSLPDAPPPEPMPERPSAAGAVLGYDPRFAEEDIAPFVVESVRAVLDVWRGLGARVVEVELPDWGATLAAWIQLGSAEMANAHADTYARKKAEYGAELAGAIESGLAVTGREVARAWRLRSAWARRLAACFEDGAGRLGGAAGQRLDAIVAPVIPGAFPADANLARSGELPNGGAAIRFTVALQPVGLAVADPRRRLRRGRRTDRLPARRSPPRRVEATHARRRLPGRHLTSRAATAGARAMSASMTRSREDAVKVDAPLYSFDAPEAEARRLEAKGYAGGFTYEGAHDPFFPLVLAARATERLELYTAVAIGFARNPMILANIGWDLQALSKGRFRLGLGTQIRPHVEKRFDMPWSKPATRMREMVLAIKEIWRCWEQGERLDFRGEIYRNTLMTPMFDPGPAPHGLRRSSWRVSDRR